MRFCFFGFHDYKCYNIKNYIDNSYAEHAHSHFLCFICENCKKTKEQIMYGSGYLDDDQIKKIKDL